MKNIIHDIQLLLHHLFQILKRDIDIPMEVPDLIHYPPKLAIAVQTVSTPSPKLLIDGLDREFFFYLIPLPSKQFCDYHAYII